MDTQKEDRRAIASPSVPSRRQTNGVVENGQRQRPHRVSFQSIEDQSTVSSAFHSPTSPNYPPEGGLAPRPPSYSHSYRARRASGGNRRSSHQSVDYGDHGRPESWRRSDASGRPPVQVRPQTRSFSARASRISATFEDGMSTEVSKIKSPAEYIVDEKNHHHDRHTDQAPILGDQKRMTASPQSELVSQPQVTGETRQREQPQGKTIAKDPASQRTIPAEGPASAARRREWAPERSPLQRLELTLQGISKAEKRAEIEEAELLAKEAKADHAGRRARRRHESTAATREPKTNSGSTDANGGNLARGGPVRSLSNKERDRIRRSATVEARNPKHVADGRDSSGGELENEEQDYCRPAASRTVGAAPAPRPSPAGRRTSQVSQDAPSGSHGLEPSVARPRVVPGGEARGLPPLNRDDDTVRATPTSAWRTFPDQGNAQKASRRREVVEQGAVSANLPHANVGRIAPTSITQTRDHVDAPVSAQQQRPGDHQEPSLARLTASDLRLDVRKGKQPFDARQSRVTEQGSFKPPILLTCGPLLRYLGIRREPNEPSPPPGGGAPASDREIWRGSVMIVTHNTYGAYDNTPTLRLFSQPMSLLPRPSHLETDDGEPSPEDIDPIAGLPKMTRTGEIVHVKSVERLEGERDLSYSEGDNGLFEKPRGDRSAASSRSNGAGGQQRPPQRSNRINAVDGEKLGKYKDVKAFRLHSEGDVIFWRFPIEVELGPQQARIAYRINGGPAIGFWVPAKGETMNIMFYSCNGFSLRVEPGRLCGPDPMWRDVLGAHQYRPFHVMIGGGNQIYNDAVMRQCERFKSWYMMKNPQAEHDIDFTVEMSAELEAFYLEQYSEWFSQGLFGIANSQIPMVNMWDDHDIIDGFGSYADRLMSSPVFAGLGTVAFKYYMLFQHQSLTSETSADEPSWILGANLGPYVSELSRNLFMSLGKKVALLALDCRTERTRNDILSDETYNLALDRCEREIVKGETRHLMVLLSAPIAYPRLVWLENMSGSRLMDPMKALRRSGMLGSVADRFDGGGEILADLGDHWTASNHKSERSWLVQELQGLADEKNVRVTFLSGDVHLAAIGQLYSTPKLDIPKDQDHRYMPNVVSSPMANAPPADMLADALNRRNKVHHFDLDTDEDMIPLFTEDVDGKPRNNKRLLPRRNWCQIQEYGPSSTPPRTPPSSDSMSRETQPRSVGPPKRTFSLSRKEMQPGTLLRRLSRRDSSRDAPPKSNRYVPEGPVPPNDSAEDYFPPQMTPPVSRPETSDERMQRPGPLQRLTTGLLPGRNARETSLRSKKQRPINLDEGLDVTLNAEVNQRDPAGITVPYRFLIPALWDNSGEQDEAEAAETQGADRSADDQENRRQARRSWFPWSNRSRSISQPQSPPQAQLQSHYYHDEYDPSNDGEDDSGDGYGDNAPLGPDGAAAAAAAAAKLMPVVNSPAEYRYPGDGATLQRTTSIQRGGDTLQRTTSIQRDGDTLQRTASIPRRSSHTVGPSGERHAGTAPRQDPRAGAGVDTMRHEQNFI